MAGSAPSHSGERSGLVAHVRCGEPVIAGGQVLAEGEAEFVLLRGLAERTDDISLRSRGNGVPARLIL